MWDSTYLDSLSTKTRTYCYDIRHPDHPGFGVSVFPSGKVSFIYLYHYDSKKRRMTIGPYPALTIDDALKIYKTGIRNLALGHDPITVRKELRDNKKIKDDDKEEKIAPRMPKYLTVKQLATMYKGSFTEASLRYLIFNKDSNGFNKCMSRVGKKILINVEKFEKWIEEEQK